MAFLWTTVKYLTAALFFSYAYWVYTEEAWPYWYYTWYLPKTRRNLSPPLSSSTRGHSHGNYNICPTHQEPFRSRFGIGLGPGSTTVYGWPKKGGVYVLNGCLGIELEFLEFDRLGEETDLSKETRSDSEEEEEAHCNRMRQLGATWWEGYYAYLYASVGVYGKFDDQILYVGWPTSGDGVWVLSLTREEAYDSGMSYGLIYNARDMDERCRMIERFGGTSYDDPRECPYLDLAE